jgi:lysophospholipase L1-like esterase
MNLRFVLLGALGIAASTATTANAAGALVLFDMDTVRHRPGTTGPQKTPIGEVKLVEGKVGRACQFSFGKGSRSGFFTAPVRATPAWDQAAGLSFWVQGDGSASWGGLELIDGTDYALRYGYCFPIHSTEWCKITVPWCDLLPELPKGRFVDAKSGYAPSRFGNLWFGKWYYWRDFPSCSFAIDQVTLEPALELDTKDYTPAAGGTPRLLAKLKSRQPITIVTMGDSLSDKRHWANRNVLWSEVLAAKLKEALGSEVKLVNPAIGGTQLTQNLILMPRWLRDTPEPDLVTIWFGYNDWDAGARGPDWRGKLRFAVDRVRRLTKGRAEVLLVTTCPALNRWKTMDDLAEAARAVAAEKKTGLADVAAAFHKDGAGEARRAALFAWDKTHLGEAGHRLTAATVFQALRQQP